MSGEGGSLAMPRDWLGPLPEPGESRALADELRDMMASGQLDQSALRRAANALEAVARVTENYALTRCRVVDLGDAEVTGDPFGDSILSSFEGGGHGDAAAIQSCS